MPAGIPKTHDKLSVRLSIISLVKKNISKRTLKKTDFPKLCLPKKISHCEPQGSRLGAGATA